MIKVFVQILFCLYFGSEKDFLDLEFLKKYEILYILNVIYDKLNFFEYLFDFKYKKFLVEDNWRVNLFDMFLEVFQFIGEFVNINIFFV